MGHEAWGVRRIGEFARRSKIINTEGAQLPPLSITKDRGVVLQSEKYKKQIATDLRKYVIARRGQFAFDPMSLYYGAIGRVTTMEIGLVSPDYVVFDVDDTIDKTFLNYLLRSPRQIAEYEAVAETGNSFGKRRRVYWSVLEQMAVRVPPLNEQRRIAATLSAADEALETTQTVIDQLQLVEKATLAELLSRGLPGKQMRLKETEIGRIPESWSVSRIRNIASLGSGTTPSRQQPAYFTRGGGTAWVKTMDLNDGLVRDTDEQVTDLALQEVRLRVYPEGTVLLAMYGGFQQIGRTGVLAMPAATNQAICPIEVDRARVLPSFLNLWLVSHRWRWRNIAASSRKDPNITKQDVAEFPVAIPPLNEQREIANVEAAFRDRLDAERATLATRRQLRTAMLSALLNGDVRAVLQEVA